MLSPTTLWLVASASVWAQDPSALDAPNLGTRPQIFGGELVGPDEAEFDAVVAVRAGLSLCSGTAISPDTVLTAAHCVDEVTDVAELMVVFGDRVAPPEVEVQVASFEVFSTYCGSDCVTGIHDFAILRLAEEVSLDFPTLVTDATEWQQSVREDAEVVLVGFGDAESGADGRKRRVTTTITRLLADGEEFQAGGDGKDSCNGDSGGPAFARRDDGTLLLLGVLSRGYECGKGGIYGSVPVTHCALESVGVEVASCEACPCYPLAITSDDGCAVHPVPLPRGQGRFGDPPLATAMAKWVGTVAGVRAGEGPALALVLGALGFAVLRRRQRHAR